MVALEPSWVAPELYYSDGGPQRGVLHLGFSKSQSEYHGLPVFNKNDLSNDQLLTF